MKFYADTTLIILIWCLILSAGWAVFCYFFQASRTRSPNQSRLPDPPILPGLVLAPLLVVAGFRFLSTNFLFPIRMEATLVDLIGAAFAPSMILMFASGLFSVTGRNVVQEYHVWRGRSFYLFIRSLGVSVDKQLLPLVLVKSIAEAWAKCLPWLFGELLIIEVVFNAPGIAYDAWNFAKQRRLDALWQPLLVLMVIYLGIYLVVTTINRWLGKRLESYA